MAGTQGDDHPTDTSEQEAELLLDVFRSKIFKDLVTKDSVCVRLWNLDNKKCVCMYMCVFLILSRYLE